MESTATHSGHANLRLLAFAVWAVGLSALLFGWDLSTVDRQGRALPDKSVGVFGWLGLVLGLVALAIGVFAAFREGDERRPYFLVGALGPISWYMWRAQEARVSGANLAGVGALFMLPFLLGATWVGIQQATLRSRPALRASAISSEPSAKAPTNALGVASVALGLLAIGTYVSVLATILGCSALRQIKRSSGTQNGRDVAGCGVVVGVLGTAAWCLSFFT